MCMYNPYMYVYMYSVEIYRYEHCGSMQVNTLEFPQLFGHDLILPKCMLGSNLIINKSFLLDHFITFYILSKGNVSVNWQGNLVYFKMAVLSVVLAHLLENQSLPHFLCISPVILFASTLGNIADLISVSALLQTEPQIGVIVPLIYSLSWTVCWHHR